MPVTIKYNSSKKQIIDMEQINSILNKLEKFKEEGSTTKWFSSEFILNKKLVETKTNINLF
jgi:tRNA uridine 5-carbamoylmethylation protein Kti12